MRELKEWIDQMHFINIHLRGMKFTWRRNNSASRIDRVLCLEDWIRRFPGLKLYGGIKSFLDHNPSIVKMIDNTNWVPSLFAFLMHGSFIRVLRNC